MYLKHVQYITVCISKNRGQINPNQVIQSAVCLTTYPQPLPKRVLHSVCSSASSFNLRYPFVSLGSTNICLRLLPRLPVTFTLPSVLPSIVCFF